MALTPFADYFNHADVAAADALVGPHGYAITASQAIMKGAEVYISYGNHSNDFLLAEYGFVLENNKWDEVLLDDLLLPLFTEEQRRKLREMDFLGKYVLDGEGVCYRTRIALRLFVLPVTQWQRLLSSGLVDNDQHQGAVDGILRNVFNSFLESVDAKLNSIKVLGWGLPSQRATLSTRWSQIRVLLNTAMKRIGS